MTLRPYQESACAAVKASWAEANKVLLVLPTGTGKTIVFSALTRDVVAQGGRVLILAHRGELLQQAADKLAKSTGLACAVEKADDTALHALERVTVGSVQTLMRPARRARFREDHYTHIIIDEAHHALSESYQSAVGYFNGAKVLGVTATPDRGDKRDLGQYFERLAFEYSLPQAIREGFLCLIRALTIPLAIELGKLSVQAGDYKGAELDSALAPYLEAIADEMAAHCRERKTLCFLPLVATAEKFAGLLALRGLRSAWVSGDHPDRAGILERYAAGAYDVLCNSMLLTEGYDDPATNCIVNLRPTRIRSLFAQIVGRGTRIHPGKENLLVLDFLWHTEKHDLCRPAHLVAETEEIATALTVMAEEAAGQPMDLTEDAIAEAQRDVIKQREEALAKKLAEMRHRKRKLVDPLQWAVSVNAEDLVDYQPSFGWEMAPPSAPQLKELEKAGILPDEITCAGMASKMLDHLQNRRTAGFATPKQVRCLERFGFQHVGEMNFQDANRMITRISANGWRLPDDLNPNHKEIENVRP
ncbi:MAG TPA: DEAD/DEAH box helicase [Verrucomicrobia bacterium]|nr:MAG: DEAD/DEAH box helicase [Lentisphaerae bacterium GWF2_57_35]HBA83920.1 DEAD/DEAH box helicase [Verrucomicrobiota bacterium]